MGAWTTPPDARSYRITTLHRYAIGKATWEGEDAMADPDTLINEFNQAAQREGLELNTSSKILLQEAVRGGWS